MEKLKKLILSKGFEASDAATITTSIMNGEATPAQIGAFLVALKLTGLETNAAIISAVAGAMRAASLKITGISNIDSSSSSRVIVDIVGTGGDGQNTFNVSTAAAIVAAGAGCTVAKVYFEL